MKKKETIKILKKRMEIRRKIKIEFLAIKGYTISDSFVSFCKEYGELFLICTFR